MTALSRLSETFKNPSGLDSMANYIGDVPHHEWLVVLTRTRDSDILTESNWSEAQAELESEDTEVFRFRHWGCGWWEALCVREGTEAEQKGREIAENLKRYPILSEEAFCEAENDEAQRIWAECYNISNRIAYIRQYRSQFEFSSFSDLLSCVRGEHFAGYASELIG